MEDFFHLLSKTIRLSSRVQFLWKVIQIYKNTRYINKGEDKTALLQIILEKKNASVVLSRHVAVCRALWRQ